MCVWLQALDWIQETGEVYLATHTSPGDGSEETQQLLNDYRHFRLTAKVRLGLSGTSNTLDPAHV